MAVAVVTQLVSDDRAELLASEPHQHGSAEVERASTAHEAEHLGLLLDRRVDLRQQPDLVGRPGADDLRQGPDLGPEPGVLLAVEHDAGHLAVGPPLVEHARDQPHGGDEREADQLPRHGLGIAVPDRVDSGSDERRDDADGEQVDPEEQHDGQRRHARPFLMTFDGRATPTGSNRDA